MDRSGNIIVGGFMDPLEGQEGRPRLVQLAAAALLPVLESLESRVDIDRVPVYVGLPEPRPGAEAADETVHFLAEAVGARDDSVWHAIPAGNGSALLALEYAATRAARGDSDLCLVGAVDSYWGHESLEWLDDRRRLISEDNLDGLVPGEGAAFILVGSEMAARHLQLTPEAALVSIATGAEPCPRTSREVCTGQGLTSVLRRVLTDADRQGSRPDWVMCDMNGETFRGSEWVYSYIRTGALHRDPLEIWHPADAWGDVGAASGAMLLAYAMHALAEGYGRGPSTLVWTASDGPARGAAVLRAAFNEERR